MAFHENKNTDVKEKKKHFKFIKNTITAKKNKFNNFKKINKNYQTYLKEHPEEIYKRSSFNTKSALVLLAIIIIFLFVIYLISLLSNIINIFKYIFVFLIGLIGFIIIIYYVGKYLILYQDKRKDKNK